nr:hypothetical protein [Tanacetum cinerariifolium]
MTTTTTHVPNAQLKTLIDQGVVDALAIRDADRSRNGHDSHNSGTGSKRTEGTTRECTYTDFLKCQPMNFKVGQDAAHSMPWSTLIKMLTAKYCPQNEIKKLEIKIWELKVKGTNVTSYTQHFQELALLCGRMFLKEFDKIEKYVSGLPDMIHGSVMASKPNTMHDARQNTGRAYTAGPGEKKPYGGSKPLWSKYNYHHDVLCAPKCHKCNRVGHLARDYKSPTTTNNQRNLTCYECRNQGQYMSDFPELKNKNHGNQARGTGARRMVHALGGGETNQDLNNMENDINA